MRCVRCVLRAWFDMALITALNSFLPWFDMAGGGGCGGGGGGEVSSLCVAFGV